MKSKVKVFWLIHAALMLIACVLALVSSSMAYAFAQMPLIAGVLACAVVLDILMAVCIKNHTLLMDFCMLLTTVLSSLAMCMVLLGRADLMGYVWFSDLESGNVVAVTSLYLSCGSMLCCLLGAIMNITDSFRKTAK